MFVDEKIRNKLEQRTNLYIDSGKRRRSSTLSLAPNQLQILMLENVSMRALEELTQAEEGAEDLL